MIYLFIAGAFAFRLIMLVRSIRHEKVLRHGGAREYGARNSRRLALAHIGFYLAASAEGIVRAQPLDRTSAAGVILYLFGAAMLLVVARLLGRLWTVKLMIAHDHVLVTHWLFTFTRHPNYFLNILPELVGYGLALHAFYTLACGLPLYAVPLAIRILQEERVMRPLYSAKPRLG